MKVLATVLAVSFLTVVIGGSDANAARRGSMSGYDNTYHSTGKCFNGGCQLKGAYQRRQKDEAASGGCLFLFFLNLRNVLAQRTR